MAETHKKTASAEPLTKFIMLSRRTFRVVVVVIVIVGIVVVVVGIIVIIVVVGIIVGSLRRVRWRGFG